MRAAVIAIGLGAAHLAFHVATFWLASDSFGWIAGVGVACVTICLFVAIRLRR